MPALTRAGSLDRPVLPDWSLQRRLSGDLHETFGSGVQVRFMIPIPLMKWMLWLVAVLVSCGREVTNPAGVPDAGGSPGDAEGSGGLQLQLNASPSHITPADIVHFEASVVGGQGTISGMLSDPSGAIVYGSFQPTSRATHQLDLSWTQLNQAASITFISEERRSFRALFQDSSGHTIAQQIDVVLGCSGLSACSGTCTDLLQDENNCGACGRVVTELSCVDGQFGCELGQHDGGLGMCVAIGTCSPGWHDSGKGACVMIGTCASGHHDGGDGACVSQGTCSAGYRDGGTGACVAVGTCSIGHHDGGAGVCVASGSCSIGYTDCGDGVCVAIGSCSTGYHDGGAGGCVALGSCSGGYHDGGSGVCVSNAECSAGFHDGGTGDCVAADTCSTGYHDGGAGACVIAGMCSIGYHDGGTGVCLVVGACSIGYHDGGAGSCAVLGSCAPSYHDGGEGSCVAAGACSGGYHDGGDGVCVLPGSCSTSYHDGGAGACVLLGQCSSGYHDGGVDACVPVGSCSDGYHDGGAGACVASGSCSTGYHDGGDGTCTASGACAPHYHDDGLGICVQLGCAAGYHDGGDGRCVIVGVCSSGYHDGGDGTCRQQGCSSGFGPDGPSRCVAGLELVATIFPATAIVADGTWVYWAGVTVGRVPLTGGAPRDLVTVEGAPVDIAVDGDNLYWLSSPDTSPVTGYSKVFSMPRDGGSVQTLGQTDPSWLGGKIAVAAGQGVHWTVNMKYNGAEGTGILYPGLTRGVLSDRHINDLIIDAAGHSYQAATDGLFAAGERLPGSFTSVALAGARVCGATLVTNSPGHVVGQVTCMGQPWGSPVVSVPGKLVADADTFYLVSNGGDSFGGNSIVRFYANSSGLTPLVTHQPVIRDLIMTDTHIYWLTVDGPGKLWRMPR